ncbi:MAG TPA: hypothetical protein VGY13_13640 [Solirubrobacteraceae bacterium]|jgi:hypothetical protein|nr:hypothetical protein [Solirubrobacteraceae bacterium]
MSTTHAVAPDAAMALGIASTAMPFARTSQDEVERWLRVLRLHGQVGIALQALGVSEEPLSEVEGADARTSAPEPGNRDAVALVTENALRIAGERHATALSTADVLRAVMQVYGEDFDHVLEIHGADREELLERLALVTAEDEQG